MKKRNYFFDAPQTEQGIKFNKNNKPTEDTFKEFLNSIPFFLEDNSIGTETTAGIFKKATQAECQANGNVEKAVMPYQLPRVFLANETANIEEGAIGGLGLYQDLSTPGRTLYMKLRLDSLATVPTVDPEKDYFIIARPDEPLNRNKSLKVKIKDVLTAQLTGGILTNTITPVMTYALGAPNKIVFTALLDGVPLALSTLNLPNMEIIFDDPAASSTKTFVDGSLEIVVTNLVEQYSSVRVTLNYNVNGVTKTTSGVCNITKDASADDYYIDFSTKLIKLGGSYPTVVETTFYLMKNGLSISFPKTDVYLTDDILNNTQTSINYEHTADAQLMQHKITFTLSNQSGGSTNKGVDGQDPLILPGYNIYVNVKRDGIYNENEILKVTNYSTQAVKKIEFIPATLALPVNEIGENQNINGKFAKLVYTEDGVVKVMNPAHVVISPSSGYQVHSISQHTDGTSVMVKITRCGDDVRMTGTYQGEFTAYIDLSWGSSGISIESDEIAIKPATIAFAVTSLGTAKGVVTDYFANAYLANGNTFKNLLTTELIVDNIPGLTIVKTQMQNSQGINYVKLHISSWDNSIKDAHNLNVTYQKTGFTAKANVLSVIKTRDGAIGDAFNIDMQGTGTPTGQGFIGEPVNYTYLDSATSTVYFKTGIAGVDTWTSGVAFGKGDKGETGDIPAHNWNDTKLSFQNPNGTWGAETDIRGLKGEDGIPIIPSTINIDPATGKLLFTYVLGGTTYNLLTTNSAKGPKGDQGDSIKGDQGVGFNFIGSFSAAPASAAINDVYRNITTKKVYVYTAGGIWQVLLEDGIDASTGLTISVENTLDLNNLTYTADDIGKQIYIVGESRYAIVHSVDRYGVATFKYTTSIA